MRTTTSRISVKITRFRSSGILKVLVKAEIIVSADERAFSTEPPLARRAKSPRHLFERQGAARLFHGSFRGFARLVHRDGELLRKGARTEDFDCIVRTADEAGCE